MKLKHMKWWGWGEDGVGFKHEDKPAFADFVKRAVDVDVNAQPQPVPDLLSFELPPSLVPKNLCESLTGIFGADGVTSETVERVVHAYGKGLRDLLRIRRGDVGRLPDVVVYPESEEQVVAVVELALSSNSVVIPFGGGTNISGSLEAPRDEQRTVICVDMGKMSRVLDIDAASRLARVQSGILGPQLELQLNEKGWTMGHFPDSFNHSTLGGWIATRSSGMQSDKYGDIADLTKAVRVVTPAGILATRPVPSCATGPSVKEMILGSEGRLGIIVEATVQIHHLPQNRQIYAYLFPDWRAGLQAMAMIARSEATPSVTRVSDSFETKFYFATKKHEAFGARIKSALSKEYLQRVKRFDMDSVCLSFVGFEGSAPHVQRQKKLVDELVKDNRGLCIGTGPGKLYDQKKFDTPYLRDFLIDRGALADVSETAAPWSKLDTLYDAVMSRAHTAFKTVGVRGYVMCHMAHSYHAGACLYFTFAFRPKDETAALKEYDVVKSAIQQTFVDFGGTLSHHHAVGIEHAAWLKEDISPAGVTLMRHLFDGVDPTHNLNPGKIVRG